MPRIDTWLECDLQHPVQVKVLNGYVFSQDNMANKIGVIVTDDGEPVTLTGTVYGYIIRSDGHTIEVAGNIEDTNRAYFIMPQEGYLVGNVSIVIKVINASEITTLAACTSYVYESRTGQEYVPTGTPIPDLSTLQEAINNANTAASAANTAATNANAIAQTVVAPEFSSSNAYAVGQYVMKSGTLYRFTSAHTAGNAWSSSEVTAVKLANDTSDLKSALTSNRTGTIELNPMAVFRTSSDVDFASMPLNTYCYGKFSVFKTALTNANFPLTWSDNDYVRMERMAATRNNQDISIITLHNFSKTEKAEMIYFASTSGNKYRWILPTTDLTKQYFPADAKAVGDALALKENISTLTANRSSFHIKPWGHYSLTTGISLDFRDMPMNTYVFTTYRVIKAGLTDTGMPDNDWSDGDYVAVFKKEITSVSSTANSILEFYNLTKTRKLEMIYYASSSTNKYRWVSSSGGTVNYNTFENTINQYSNSYTVTATPSITTDTNNYLQPSGDTTDMSTAIETMLTQTGICNLAPGDFYVSGIDMPEGTTIRGCGDATNIVLLDSVTSGYAIKMGSKCIVDSVMISGGTSVPEITSNVGTRNGILWQGTAIPGTSTTSSEPTRGTISNCYIRWFIGSGIYCYGTGTGISNCLNVANVYVYFSRAGVNISWLSEFHRFTNVDCRGCYYGIINNGGNNTFANCGFSKNMVGLLMDNTIGQSNNNSHGSFANCVFNHSGSDNDGIAIHIIGCTNGEMFVGCQIFYGITDIKDSYGIVFDSCNYGNGSSAPVINIDGGGLVMFNGCCFGNVAPTITKTNNTATKLANCYLRDGTAVTVS